MEEIKAVTTPSYQSLNALVSVMDKDGNYPLHLEKKAAKEFFLTHINQNTVFFHNHQEKLDYLLEEEYYDSEVFNLYSREFIYSLIDYAYSFKFRFKTLLGSMKFFSAYALKTRDGTRYLERYEDRVVACALYLAQGDETLAKEFVTEIIEGRYQPATPTFSNAGKKNYGEKVSCFILQGSDNLEDITRQWANAAQLSKRGGGVGICITDWRAFGDPIRGMKGKASGLIGWCKVFESIFLKVDQLGQRLGAGVVWVNALHLDAPDLIDCKKENVDDTIRLKVLNIGLVVPDILIRKAEENKKVYLFSPYDVERVTGKPMSQISLTEHYDKLAHHPDVRKKAVDARMYFQDISAVQIESGYPFLMFEDTVNKANPIKGHVSGSNLCVHGDTLLLTLSGEEKIKDLVGKSAMVWNGKEWSLAPVFQTSSEERLLRITLESGKYLECTYYHKWYPTRNGEEVEVATQDLKIGDVFHYKLPVEVKEIYPENTVNKISPFELKEVVKSIEEVEGLHPVYCVNEPSRHRATFNRILTGNCSEILQVATPSTYNVDGSYKEVGKDISCNLGSINVFRSIVSGDFRKTVEHAVQMCTTVSRLSNFDCVPPVKKGNEEMHAIGIGAMNLHGCFGAFGIEYDSEDAVQLTDVWFMSLRYHALKTSNKIAKELNTTFSGFEESKYKTGEAFSYYLENDYHDGRLSPKITELIDMYSFPVPTISDWKELMEEVKEYGLYHSYLLAVAPTGSVSYINHATASIHPISSQIEERHEGKVYAYYPAPEMTNENRHLFKDAFQLGYKAVIDVYAAATKHVDQGLSLTLFFQQEETTTRNIDRARYYAWKKGIKTLYYVRMRQETIARDVAPVCEACSV